MASGPTPHHGNQHHSNGAHRGRLRGIAVPVPEDVPGNVPGSFNVDNATRYLQENSSRTRSAHGCAAAIHRALADGGIHTDTNPRAPMEARDYGPFLAQKGFQQVATGCGDATPENYQPQAGDCVVYRDNHVAMYCDDKVWRSDFTQNCISPGGPQFTAPRGEYAIYRHPNTISSNCEVNRAKGHRLQMGGLY